MNALEPAPVPDRTDAWVRTHRRHLVNELRATSGSRPANRRLVLVCAGAAAATAGVLALTLVEPGTPNAFAGWTAAPTKPGHGQVISATQACSARLRGMRVQPGRKTSSLDGAKPRPVLEDTRGPYSVIVYTGGGMRVFCISGPSFTSIAGAGATSQPPPPAGMVMPARVSFTSRDGHAYTLIAGRTGSGVTRVTLDLTDGRSVQATTENGWFAAWWPGAVGIPAAQVATATGTTAQRLGIIAPQGHARSGKP
jgi:hypothetical protein